MINSNEYLHEYNIALTPVSKKKIDFENDSLISRQGKVKSFIHDKLMEFSNKSKSSIYNSKVVDEESIHISNRIISFKLYSMEEISVLGRSVRLFSQLVLEEKYFENLLVKKKLFTTFIPVEKKTDDNEIKIVDVAVIPDAILVKGLVDILPLPEYSIKAEVRTAIEKMKVLAVEAGIVKLSE